MPPVSRRTLISHGLVGGALLWGAGWVAPRRASAAVALKMLSVEQAAVVAALADTFIIGVDDEPSPADVEVVAQLDTALTKLHPSDAGDLLDALGLIESAVAGFLLDLRPSRFTALDRDGRTAAILAWRDSRLELRRSAYKVLRSLIVASYYGSPQAYAFAGYPGPPEIVR